MLSATRTGEWDYSMASTHRGSRAHFSAPTPYGGREQQCSSAPRTRRRGKLTDAPDRNTMSTRKVGGRSATEYLRLRVISILTAQPHVFALYEQHEEVTPMPHERLVHARGRQDPSRDRSVLTAHHTYRKGDHVMHNQSTLVRIGVLAVLFALAGSLVSAEPPDADKSVAEISPLLVADDQPYQFMVKFVCGDWEDMPTVVDGLYTTAINVYNYTDHAVRIYKRPSFAYRETASPDSIPPVIAWKTYNMRARRTLVIDCPDLYWMAGINPGTPYEGMIQISLPEKLPVVAVYTSSADDWTVPPDGHVDSGACIHVQEYQPFVARIAPQSTVGGG